MNKKAIQKTIAVLMAIIINITIFQSVIVSASENRSIEGCAQYEIEKMLEAIGDSYSNESAGDWNQARLDGFWWNSFHNEVQRHIRERYKMMGRGEKEVLYYDTLGNERKGRIDLYMPERNKTLIWEVKPYSYMNYPKRLLAINQLTQYKSSDNEQYEYGGNQITGGTTYLYKDKVVGNTVEHITYRIVYVVGSDGIIIYNFFRSSKIEQADEALATEKSFEKQYSWKDAMNEIIYGEDEIATDVIKTIQVLTVIATSIKVVHEKINSNPDTCNSFSAAIVAACNTFLMKVASLDLTSASGIQAAKMSIYDFELAIETYLGEEYLEEILEALESEDEETLNKLISNIQDEADEYDESTKTKPNRDPLVIDLGTKGIELTDVLNGVNFDLDNNGFAEKTAWIGTEDGFLAYDRNRNGIIDNGGELFGDQVVLSNGLKSTSGFESLSELDSNKDLIIDSKDSKFRELLVWIDSNHNGVSDAEELFSLTDLGIISISLEHENVRILDKETGTLKSESADVVINVGGNVTETEISEFWFEINTTSTTQNGKVTAGNVPDIKDIIMNDESGEVYELLCKFGDSDSIAEKHYYVKQILYHITGATDIAYNNRGGNIDARELKVIEEFMGREFVGVDGNNPNGRAATILKSIYSNIENKYYNILNMYCGLGGYLKIVYEYEDEAGDKLLNLSLLSWLFTEKINSGENIDYLIYDLGLYLIYYDEINGTHYYDEYCEYYSNISADIATIVAMTGNCRTYIGTEGNDVFYGTEGNDVIVGDGGNDVLRGDIGNDIYIFEIGDGMDVIQDYENSTTAAKEDTIVFGEGIDPDDLLLQRKGSNLIIQYTETDSITVERVYDNDAGKFFVENIHFADGTKWSKEDIIDKASVRYGTEAADRISGYIETSVYSNDEIIYGGAGNDTIGGACGQDELYGEEGNDTLRGGIENDVLVGGVGHDTLSGDEGNDTYIFEIGDGMDVIQDYENSTTEGKEDTIVFGEGIDPDDLLLQRKGSNLIIQYTETDIITVERVYDNDAGKFFVENIHFADGTKWSKEDIIDKASVRYGTDTADRISGYVETSIYSNDEIIYGGVGDDTIGGACGQDELYGEEGNDTLRGGIENDVLVGGVGHDTLSGDEGNDTYIFAIGDGMDVIQDYENSTTEGKEDTIVFGEGIDPDDLLLQRKGSNLIIQYTETDIITVERVYDNDAGKFFVENIHFADGTKWSKEDIIDKASVRYGTDKADRISGYVETSIYSNDEIIYGGAGDDTIGGACGQDELYGEEGNDTLRGGVENDVLVGGIGNDTLSGDEGNDTYIFEIGDGVDVIQDYENSTTEGKEDTIVFGEGIDPDDLLLQRKGSNLIIQYTETDIITVERVYDNDVGKFFVENIHFADGIKWSKEDIIDKASVRYGTDTADRISGYVKTSVYSNDEIIYGGAGNDTIGGSCGQDELYGGVGNDILLGGTGSDVIVGGVGNDTLRGEEGNDTYIFEKGDGEDIIKDYENSETGGKEDTIIFGAGITPEDVLLQRKGSNLIIQYTETDSITVEKAYDNDNGYYFIENIHFADGIKWSKEDIIDKASVRYGTDTADRISGYVETSIYSNDEIIYGGAGDDTIGGACGQDELYGEEGNDTLRGGIENDVLIGGIGNDTLSGDEGNDTYIFEIGDGMDVIQDYENSTTEGKEDTIVFGEGISSENVLIQKKGSNLVIQYTETDCVTVENAYGKEGYSLVEYIHFADGTIINSKLI